MARRPVSSVNGVLVCRPVDCNNVVEAAAATHSNELFTTEGMRVSDAVPVCSNFVDPLTVFNDSVYADNSFSALKYIDVRVSSDDGDSSSLLFSALCGSGAEICCVRADLAGCLNQAIVSHVQLRPFYWQSIRVDVARFRVFCDGHYIEIYAAIVPGLHDELILTAGTVDRLFSTSNTEVNLSRVTTRNMSRAARQVDDNDDDDICDDIHESDDNVSASIAASIDDSKGQVPNDVSSNMIDDDTGDNEGSDVDAGVCSDDNTSNDASIMSRDELIREQKDDLSLQGAWKLAQRNRGGFLVQDGVLYHRATVLEQSYLQLVVPSTRNEHVLKMGHENFGGHMSAKHTKTRIAYTFYWPTLAEDCCQFCKTCESCQFKARVTFRDRVPIKPIPHADCVFDHWFIDCASSFFRLMDRNPYNYAFIAVDSFSRFPVLPIEIFTARAVCDCLLSLWQFTGCSTVLIFRPIWGQLLRANSLKNLRRGWDAHLVLTRLIIPHLLV